MSEVEIARAVAALTIVLAGAHGLAHLFERARQPRFIGEILAGVLLGPAFLGTWRPDAWNFLFGGSVQVILSFLSWLGLLLLMFLSGTEIRHLLPREDRGTVAWLLVVGTGGPFLAALLLRPAIDWGPLVGSAGNELAVVLIFAASVAVTSIPVISRIFHDLGLLSTRFARLILATAVLEDIGLWAVVTIAVGLVHAGTSAAPLRALAVTGLYCAAGLWLAPPLLSRLLTLRCNFLARRTPIAYLVLILLAYAACAGFARTSLIFAAFLAGFGAVGGIGAPERQRFTESLESLSRVSFAVFIPIYFAMVGHRLPLREGFPVGLCLTFLLGSSVMRVGAVIAASRAAGFREPLDLINLGIVANARGGPGIVMATIALDAGIISRGFFGALVLTAVLTSQAAGAWLRLVLARGWPLLDGKIRH